MTRPGSGNLALIGCSLGENIMTINLPRIIESYVEIDVLFCANELEILILASIL